MTFLELRDADNDIRIIVRCNCHHYVFVDIALGMAFSMLHKFGKWPVPRLEGYGHQDIVEFWQLRK